VPGHALRLPPQATAMTPEGQPPRPLPALSAAELTAYRRQLERAIAFFSRQDPVPPVQAGLQARLDQVIAALDHRAGPARA
jgi:hypothetical protein